LKRRKPSAGRGVPRQLADKEFVKKLARDGLFPFQ
jgi:hypothetical protein